MSYSSCYFCLVTKVIPYLLAIILIPVEVTDYLFVQVLLIFHITLRASYQIYPKLLSFEAVKSWWSQKAETKPPDIHLATEAYFFVYDSSGMRWYCNSRQFTLPKAGPILKYLERCTNTAYIDVHSVIFVWISIKIRNSAMFLQN